MVRITADALCEACGISCTTFADHLASAAAEVLAGLANEKWIVVSPDTFLCPDCAWRRGQS